MVRSLISDYAGSIETVRGQERLMKPLSQQATLAIREASRVITRDLAPAHTRGGATAVRVKAELGRMIAGYSAGAPDQEGTLDLMMAELTRMPLWVIAQACDEVRFGGKLARELEIKPAFLPSVPQMVQLCEAIMGPWRALADTSQRLLTVKVASDFEKMTPDDHARMRAKMQAFADEVKTVEADRMVKINKAADERMASVNERMRLMEYESAGIAPEDKPGGIPVSLSLLRNLGAIVRDEPESPGGRNAGGGNGKSRRR
jgi:hypothetical protein